MTESAATFSRFDKDPEALAWARSKVMHEIERMRRFEQQATERGSSDPTQWRRFRVMLERSFIGGEGCVIAAFDERKPGLVAAIEEGSNADF